MLLHPLASQPLGSTFTPEPVTLDVPAVGIVLASGSPGTSGSLTGFGPLGAAPLATSQGEAVSGITIAIAPAFNHRQPDVVLLGTPVMKNVHNINSDTCDLRVEIEGESVFLWVKEDGFDGKVEAMTQLSRDDAKELRDRLNDFLEH